LTREGCTGSETIRKRNIAARREAAMQNVAHTASSALADR
jgi:hypothetical protein